MDPATASTTAPPDAALLRAYAHSASDTAFAALVSRHVNLVYAAARRQLPGDAAHLADDVTQAVFILLAQKARAGRIPPRTLLAGWLHTTTRYAAANARRAAATRRAHEHKAAQMIPAPRAANATAHNTTSDWNALAPHLDAALSRLSAPDRDAVLLRFLQDKSHAEVGAQLGLTEEAARKRISRALDRLRNLLLRRGVALPATATLATLLTTHAAEAAPASVSLAAACGFAPSAAMTATTLAQSTLATLTLMKLKTAAVFLVAASLLTTAVISVHKLRAPRPAPRAAAPLTLVLAPAAPKAATYTGKVLTPDGKPAPAARVILAFPADDLESDPVTRTTRAGDDGAFAFRDIPAPTPARSPVLFATAPGHALAQAHASAEEENELTLSPATTLRVTVLDPAGKPVPDLRLTPAAVVPRGPGFTYIASLIPEIARELAQQTDPSGVATFGPLPVRSTLRLDVRDPRFARVSINDGLDTADNPTAATRAATLRLRAGGTISGLVTFGPTGKPAAGIRVGAQALDRDRTGGWGHALTNDRGEYRMEQVAAGDYNVMLGSNGPDLRRDWAAAAREGVHLDPGQNLADQDLTLVKGILITGRVTRADSGKPVAGQGVGCYSPIHPRSSAMIDSVRTDADGAFTFRTLPGKHKVYLCEAPPDGYKVPKELDLSVAEGQPPIDFALERKPGKPVAGRVLDVDGKPLPGASVVAEDPKGGMRDSAHTLTDERGDFYFEAVAPGTLLRAYRGSRETPAATPVNGGEPEVVLRLEKRLRITLTGTVTDASDKPIANAKVEVIQHQGQFGMGMGRPELTDANGRYRITGLSPSARYTVQAKSPGFGSAGAQLTLDPSKATAEAPPLRFEAHSRPIAGTVVDKDDKPLPNITVELDATDDPEHRTATTDPQGHFTFHVIAGTRGQLYTRDAAGKPFRPTDARAGDANLLLKTPR